MRKMSLPNGSPDSESNLLKGVKRKMKITSPKAKGETPKRRQTLSRISERTVASVGVGRHTTAFCRLDIPNLMLKPDSADFLPWHRAVLLYKSKLAGSSVEISLNEHAKYYAEKTIFSVYFRDEFSQDKERASQSYTFLHAPVGKHMLPAVPGGDKHLVWSEIMPLMSEIDRERHLEMLKLVLQKRFHKLHNWVELAIPGDDTRAQEESIALTLPEFWMIGRSIIDDQEMLEKSKLEMLKRLFLAGESAYQYRTAKAVQEAFVDGLTDSSGRQGLEIFLRHICDIIDGDKLCIKSHGSSNDGFGVNMSKIPHFDFADVGGEGGDVTDEELDSCSDVEPYSPFKSPKGCSPASTRGKRRRRSSAESSRSSSKKSGDGPQKFIDNADMTVFCRRGSLAVPLIVVAIKSHNVDDLFQMQKHLLGAAQFTNEIFGLLVNPIKAKIYRMKKVPSSKKIMYAFEQYEFLENDGQRFVWDSSQFVNLFDDICRVFRYGAGFEEL